MDKTSASYSTARRQLLAKSRSEPDPEAIPEPAPEARRPYSDEVVRANTGRTWDEWFALLDNWGGAERPHPEIARWLGGDPDAGTADELKIFWRGRMALKQLLEA